MLEENLTALRTRVSLKPGRPGTRALLARYGDRLVCVRHRYDKRSGRSFKTNPKRSLPPAGRSRCEWTGKKRRSVRRSRRLVARGTLGDEFERHDWVVGLEDRIVTDQGQ